MSYVLIIHEVEDYAAWKQGFDEAASLRKNAGEVEYRLLKQQNEENRIVHFSKWQSLAQARAFFESDEVKEIRRNLSVKDPEFIYLESLESGRL